MSASRRLRTDIRIWALCLRVERGNPLEAKVPSDLSVGRLLAPWMNARKRGGCDAPRLSTGRSIALGAYYAGRELARNAGRRGPQRGLDPASHQEPYAPRRPGGARFLHPRAAPRPQPRAQKARPSASYSGRARAEQRQQRHRASINIHITSVIIVRSRHILERRLSANNKLPKAPPAPLKGLGAFFARRPGPSQYSLSLDKLRGHDAVFIR
jgi:hypothetical protein